MPTVPTFRSRLVAREPLYGAWSVIPSPLSVRLLAAAGLDYVVIDLQHGGATEHDLTGMTAAIRLAGATPVGRVRHAHPADIGRALDLGCEGVIVPNVDSAAQALQVAGAVRYPPAGRRSAGGVLAAADPFCLVMVESAEAVASLDDTLAVDGVDGIYVGPRDLSLALGCEPDPDDPVLGPALERIRAACAAAGKPVGIHAADGAVARRYREAGCTLLTTTADAAAIVRDTAAQAGRARALPRKLGYEMDSWNVALIDQTAGGVVPAAELRQYAAALQQQVDDHLAPAWQVRADISVLGAGDDIPPGTWPISIVDTLGQDGVHLDDDGQPSAKAVNGDQLSITLSHELLEMLVDPQGARFIKAPCLDRNFAGRLVCYLVEVADPVEPYSYEIGGVQVADFVLPSFFDPGATGHVDFSGFLPGPLTVPLGCYISWFDPIGHRWHEQKPDGTFHIGLPTLSRVSRADRDLAYGAAERGRHDATEIYRAWPGEVRRVPGPGSPPPG